uniref:Predicted protein n=1 Tax=Physcomitrium patens TaxID=3218 RepID=A9U3Z2_PHYPA
MPIEYCRKSIPYIHQLDNRTTQTYQLKLFRAFQQAVLGHKHAPRYEEPLTECRQRKAFMICGEFQAVPTPKNKYTYACPGLEPSSSQVGFSLNKTSQLMQLKNKPCQDAPTTTYTCDL